MTVVDRTLVSLEAGDSALPQAATRTTDRSRAWLLPVGLAMAAFVLRAAFVARAYELFIDEVTYTEVSRNLVTGHGLSVYGRPFELHPPLLFFVLGAVIKAGGLTGHAIAPLALDLRFVLCVIGALVVGVTFALVQRLSTRMVAAAVALFIAVDPFTIQFDSRVL